MGSASSRADVLRTIALDGPIARARIAERLGMSGATVTAVTRELLDAGLVQGAGTVPAAGRRGRPQEMLSITSGAATVVGAKLADTFVSGVVTDLTGNVLETFRFNFDGTAHEPAERLIEDLGAAVDSRRASLIGIGLGVPGTVVAGPAGLVTSPMLGWRDLDLVTELAEGIGVPVIASNDVNALATGQRLYGVGRGVEDYLTITVGRGIGLGIVLDGAVRRGRGGAGEFGHTRAEQDGPPCPCGRRGCLERVVAEPALVRRAVAEGLLGESGTIEDLREQARENAAALRIFVDAGRLLGDAAADLVNLLAPSQLVIAGEGLPSWPLYEQGFTPALEHGVLDFHRGVPVVVDEWADDTWARGAAALVLGSALQPSADDATSERIVGALHPVDEQVGA